MIHSNNNTRSYNTLQNICNARQVTSKKSTIFNLHLQNLQDNQETRQHRIRIYLRASDSSAFDSPFNRRRAISISSQLVFSILIWTFSTREFGVRAKDFSSGN